jgi:hypothetical protein
MIENKENTEEKQYQIYDKDYIRPLEQENKIQFRQTEIITGIVYPTYKYSFDNENNLIINIEPNNKYDHAIIISQDCDLEQASSTKKGSLPYILFCEVKTAQNLKGLNPKESDFKNSSIWKNIRDNNDNRYHFLEEIPQEYDLLNEGIEELGIDFKRYFTISYDEVCNQISNKIAHRRTKLCSPYLEHLSHRFSKYLSRVGLLEDHKSKE